MGIGFAIPSDTVQYVVSQLMRFGKVRRPWMGATLQPLPNSALGMLVVSVAPGSPADQAGLHPGDLIAAINGRPVHRVRDVIDVLEHAQVGGRIRIQVLRGNTKLWLSLVLKELPSSSQKKSAS